LAELCWSFWARASWASMHGKEREDEDDDEAGEGEGAVAEVAELDDE
jgi:hypothetical protein